jgi:hypothetical protein
MKRGTLRTLTWPARLVLESAPGELSIHVDHINIVVIASPFSALPL